jgi:predicted CXXCH cytochrome family protein
MKFGSVLLLAAAGLFIAVLSLRAQAPTAPANAGDPSTQAAASVPTSQYVGSRACERCHKAAFDQWEQSLHIRMTKPIGEATVVGDFAEGTRFEDHGRSFEFGRAGGKPFMRVSFGGGTPETFQVDYTLGHKRYQGYLSKLPDGRMYVLPAFWHVATGRWVDWKEITPIPDGAHNLRQIWNSNCFNCHATNLVQGFNVETKAYETTWTEMGVGCEACHGPGGEHVALIDAWRKDPALKPGGTLGIFSSRHGSPRQTYDMCAYCHGNKRNTFVGFRAGDRYEDYALPFLISEPIPPTDLQGEFWPDGRPNRFNRPQALTLSGCFKAGEATCTSCHTAHGSPNPFSLKVDITQGANGDTLCTQCHSKFTGASVERHTFHNAASEGSRCITCHMSDVNWRLLIRRRDHTFQSPVPEMTSAFGAPNACTTCHDNRSPEWAARQMDVWWGNGSKRKAAVAIADTMYRAGSGDASTLPSLARLAVDRSNGVLIRASAVEFIEQLALGTAGVASADAQSQTSFGYSAQPAAARRPGIPAQLTAAQINALMGAASDPEPMVRAQAVTALLAAGPRERVITPIVARLVDSARVVRARAAQALLALGIASLPGKPGEALNRAQDDYAQSLRDFPESAANHAALGWLQAERDRTAEAHAALDRALSLDPRSIRALVTKGVLAARAGRIDDALTLWQKAKSIEPGHPNIDQLIAEGEKRKRAGP